MVNPVCIVEDKTKAGQKAAGVILPLVWCFTLWLSTKVLDCPTECLPYVRYLIGLMFLVFVVKIALLIITAACYGIAAMADGKFKIGS